MAEHWRSRGAGPTPRTGVRPPHPPRPSPLPGALLAASLIALRSAASEPDASPPAPARDLSHLSLEELMEIEVPTVYGASRHEQKASWAQASISILTAEDIRTYGYRNLGEALSSLAGTYLATDRNYSYLGIRGFLRHDYMSRILLLVDGHRVNENMFDSFYLGADEIVDVDLIERVELIRGPGSALYGNSAFLGVVNVRTRTAAQINGVEASAEAGAFETYKGRATLGEILDSGTEVVLSASAYDSAGDSSLYFPEFDDPGTNHGWAESYDAEAAYHVSGNVRHGDLTFSGAFSLREKEVPTASFGTVFNARREETREQRAYLDLAYDTEAGPDTRVLARVFYDQYRYSGIYPYEGTLPDDPLVLNKDEAEGDWIGAETQVTHTLFDVHTVIAGVEYRENLRQYQANFDEETTTRYLSSDRTSRNVGAFVQTEVRVTSQLEASAGFRYDDYSTFGDSLNPRAALVYQPFETTSLKALYGEAFRAPNEFEMHYSGADGFRPTGDLKPESIQTYELVWEQRFARTHQATLSGYFYQIDDLISQTADADTGAKYFDNLDQVGAIGLETAWQGRFHHGISAHASYALQRARDENQDKDLSHSPHHLVRAGVRIPIAGEHLAAAFEVRYQGESLTLQGATADDFCTGNLTLLSRELSPGLEISASIYNLWDARYQLPGSPDHRQDTLDQDGRTFRFKVTYRF